MAFGIFYVSAFMGGLCLILSLMEIIYNIMYKLFKWFRRAIKKFLNSLPDYWE